MCSVLAYLRRSPEEAELAANALALLAFARAVADAQALPLAALLLGPGASTAASKAIACGADRVHVCERSFDPYGAERHLAALEAAARAAEASVVALASDSEGRDLAGRLACRLDAGAVTEVTGFRPGGEGLLWERPVYGGNATGLFRATAERVVVGVRARSGEAAVPDPSRVGEVIPLECDLPEHVPVTLLGRAAPQGLRLEDARVVVSGGRGLGGPEAFSALERLASLLGGTVGASRAACDAGWVPSTHQVGQTGAMVAPDLYLAIGISGASQHLAGIGAARIVVAINRDAQAPIFRRADLGIVGDYRELLPAIEHELRRVLGDGT